MQNYTFSGHMVAVGVNGSPAIIVGVILIRLFSKMKFIVSSLIKHSFTNGSVLLITGSLIIGFIASDQQALGIKPLQQICSKDFSYILTMGIVSGRKLNDFFQKWMVQLLLCNHYPLINGIVVAYLSHLITETLVTALFCSPRFEVRHTLQYPRR
jgi:hypothetical protein